MNPETAQNYLAQAIQNINAEYQQALSELNQLDSLIEHGKDNSGRGLSTLDRDLNQGLGHHSGLSWEAPIGTNSELNPYSNSGKRYKSYHYHASWGADPNSYTYTGYYNQTDYDNANNIYKNDIEGYFGAQAKSYEQAIEKIDPGAQVVLQLVNQTSGIFIPSSFNVSTNDNVAAFLANNNNKSDANLMTTYLTSLFVALQDQLKANKNEQKIQASMQTNERNHSEIAQEIIHYRLQMDSDINGENTTLSSLETEMLNDRSFYLSQKDQGNIDAAKATEMGNLIGLDDQTKYHAELAAQNAKGVRAAINQELGSLGNAIAHSTSEQLATLQNDLDEILKKIQKIIENPKLSNATKATEILALTMFALQIITMIQSTIQNQKAKNEKEIATANVQASQDTIQRSQADSQILAQALQEESALDQMKLATTIIGGVLCCFMGSIGGAIIMATLTGLQAKGDMDKLTNWLGDQIHSQVGAKWIVLASSILIGIGGGAILDKTMDFAAERIIAKSVEEAADAAVQGAAQSIQKTVADAKQEIQNPGAGKLPLYIPQTRVYEATDAAMDTAEKAAKKAIELTISKFSNKSISALLEMGFRGTLKQELEKSIEEAASKAAEEAANLSKNLVKDVMEKGIANVPVETEINKIAMKAVQGAIKEEGSILSLSKIFDLFGKKDWLDDVKASDTGQVLGKVWEKGLKRVLLAMTFDSVTISNFMPGLFGKESSETGKTLAQVIPMVSIMGSCMGEGSGSTILLNAQAIGFTVNQSIQAGSSLAMSHVDELQADATTGLQMSTAVSELLHSLWKQIHQDASKEVNHYIALQKAENKQISALSAHMFDGDKTGVEVLMSQAV